MVKGTVKWFNSQKGFGFISQDNGDSDVFVHITALQAAGIDGLNDGDKVSFDIEENRGKTVAANIQILG